MFMRHVKKVFIFLLMISPTILFGTFLYNYYLSSSSLHRSSVIPKHQQNSFFTYVPNASSTEVGSLLNIAIVTILDAREDLEKYEIASNSIACYSLHHNYSYHIVIRRERPLLSMRCQQKSLMFVRHCIAAHVLNESLYDYVLFTDGDTGVINPMHRIEEYIIPNKDIIFYNRMWNFEIMAGGFIARNSPFAIKFLHNWAAYDSRRSFLSDNAAIHSAVLDFSGALKSRCEEIWEKSETVYECFLYEACARRLMEQDESWKKHIAIIAKGKAWVRDCWLTNSKWSQHDFMLHGWQKGRANVPGTATWIYPFTEQHPFQNRSLCSGPDYLREWPYINKLIKTDEQIQMAFKHIISDVEQQYRNALAEVDEYFATGIFSKNETMKLLFVNRGSYPDFIELQEQQEQSEIALSKTLQSAVVFTGTGSRRVDPLPSTLSFEIPQKNFPIFRNTHHSDCSAQPPFIKQYSKPLIGQYTY